MKLNIVAATGGIGRHLVEQAVAGGHDVTAVARRRRELPDGVRTVTVDLTRPDTRTLAAAVSGADPYCPRSARETRARTRASPLTAPARSSRRCRQSTSGGSSSSAPHPSDRCQCPASRRHPSTTPATASSCATWESR